MSELKRETKAFPSTYVAPDESKIHYFGMDLRDYFAAKAMQGMLNNVEIFKEHMRQAEEQNTVPLNIIVKDSYKFADAMMEARK